MAMRAQPSALSRSTPATNSSSGTWVMLAAWSAAPPALGQAHRPALGEQPRPVDVDPAAGAAEHDHPQVGGRLGAQQRALHLPGQGLGFDQGGVPLAMRGAMGYKIHNV